MERKPMNSKVIVLKNGKVVDSESMSNAMGDQWSRTFYGRTDETLSERPTCSRLGRGDVVSGCGERRTRDDGQTGPVQGVAY